VFKEQGRI